ncbi:hypothetical protein [Streptomyces sp. NPDC001652]|uniref:hypothetical protein n=1 Tax=Streptomyces sp. NPDC001652 TaxID=3154393 RepID=UPI00331841C4
MTATDVYIDRRGAMADALLDQPARHRRPSLDTTPTLSLTALLIDDPPPGTDQGVELGD